jgi:hypothetical protein
LPDLIAFIVAISLIAILLITNILAVFKNKRLVKEAIQLNIDKVILLEKVEKLLQERDNKALEESNGFLRFVSESRDWAFKYIEDVQLAITELTRSIDSKNDANIEKAFNNLKNFLPNEEENTNNNKENK